MDIKVIKNALKNYKRKKSIIETTLARIEVFEMAIQHPEMHSGLFLKPSKEFGMPRGSNNSGTSIVEATILSEEKERELLKEWINDDKSRIYPLQIEIEQINGALNALTKQQRFIIELKYFEGMFWRDIETNFNDTFRQKNYITYEALKKINKEALTLMAKILVPYYKRFKNI